MAEVKEIQGEPQVQLTMSKSEAAFLASLLCVVYGDFEENQSLWVILREYYTDDYAVSAKNGTVTVSKTRK